MGDDGNGGVIHVWGRGYMEIVLSVQFCCEPKTAPKIKTVYKKAIEMY